METLTFRQPRIVALALLVIIAAGLASLLAIGRQEDPTITNLFGTVTTIVPGADPARVEALVTQPIEDALREVSEVDVIQSTSATGISIIAVELGVTVPKERIELVWAEIRDDLSALAPSLPADAFEPDFDTDRSSAYAAIAAFSAAPGVPTTILGRYARDLAQDLRNIPGTELVELFGAPEDEVLITLDPTATAALGLTATDISRAIASGDAKGPAGRVRPSGSDLLISVAGEVETLDRIGDIVIRRSDSGAVTYLNQVADITRGPRLPQSEIAFYNGNPAVLMAAKLESGLQVDVWSGFVRDEIDAFQDRVPMGTSLDLTFDQSRYTADRLTEVDTNMAIGVSLVVGVLLLTLGLRSALIVALILPVVTLATLFTMNYIGLAIHQMSVTGLIVALGLLVDAGHRDDRRSRPTAGKRRQSAQGCGPISQAAVCTPAGLDCDNSAVIYATDPAAGACGGFRRLHCHRGCHHAGLVVCGGGDADACHRGAPVARQWHARRDQGRRTWARVCRDFALVCQQPRAVHHTGTGAARDWLCIHADPDCTVFPRRGPGSIHHRSGPCPRHRH